MSSAPDDAAALHTVDGVEVFEPPPERRSFAPTDLLRLLVGVAIAVVGFVLGRVGQASIRGIESDLVAVFGRLPDGLGDAVLSAAQLITSFVPTVALVVLLVRRRFVVAGLLLVSGALAALVAYYFGSVLFDTTVRDFIDQIERSDGTLLDPGFPSSAVVASTTAVVTVAAPWLSRSWQRALWWSVGVLVLLRLLAVTAPALDLVLCFGIGLAVGSLVLLVFGTPSQRPGPDELVAALRRADFEPRRIEAPASRRGALLYTFADAEGVQHQVVLRTPEERDAELLARVYRSVRYRSSEVGTRHSTLKRRIEHEVLLVTLARDAGVRAPKVLRIGTTEGGSAFYVAARHDTRPIEASELDEGSASDLWAQVDALHRVGVAHRHLALESIELDGDGEVWLGDFDGSHTAPSDRELARDVAQLLVETAIALGVEPAVRLAVERVGAATVAAALPMLQPLALPASTRERAKAGVAGDLLADLRQAVTAQTGAADLELEELERVKPRTVLMIAASALAFYALLPQLANLEDTIDAFGDADPAWIAGALAASALTYLASSVALQGAVAEPLPFGPSLRSQLAASFAGLVGPAGLGGFALTARFLERVGVGRAEAGTSVAVKGIAGLATHLVLLFAFVAWTGSTGVGSFSVPGSQTILIVLVVVLVVAGGLLAIRPVRRAVLRPLVEVARSGAGQIGRVFRSPERVAALFGGSAGMTLTYVAAVACCVQAFGGDLTFSQVGAAYLVAVAIASIAPTPGNLGAIEAAMIAGLTGFGLADGIAVSATLTFRLATFWLPLLPGWFAMEVMQRRDEL